MIVIDEKLKPSDKVLRYMSFDKFMDIVHNNKIYLARVDELIKADKFEGSYTKQLCELSKCITIDGCNQGMVDNIKRITGSAYVSCWTLSDYENMALWKLYGDGGKNTIAIEITIEALETELKASEFNTTCIPYRLSVFMVDYIDHYSNDDGLSKELLANERMPLRKKAMAYSYESEVRIIIDHLSVSPSVGQELQKKLGIGVNLNVNIDRLISKIYVSPLADDWFYDLLKSMLKNYGMCNLVNWSNMRQTPVEEVFGKSKME